MLGKELSQALSDISDEKIAEAAAVTAVPRKCVWPGLVAAAAVLVILLGAGALLWPGSETPADYLPIFAIRAYAADGMINTLSGAGETSSLSATENDLFPGKQTYTLDVSLTNADGSRLDLTNSTFEFPRYNRELLQPGHSDEHVSIALVDEEGFYGYRIVGWCDKYDFLDITIRDKKGMILHQKTVWVQFSEQYNVTVRTSYTYEEGLSTEELITKLFDTNQDYAAHTMIASSPYVAYSCLVSNCGGFKELEQRSDAASLLLERWLREMKDSEHKFVSVQGSGRVGLVLSQTPHWRNLTEEERALIESLGYSRGCPEPEENFFFPGHRIFGYELKMEEHEPRGCRLEISYNGITVWPNEGPVKDEHFSILNIYGAEVVPEDIAGWSIVGWFDEPTEITLSVYDGDELIRQEVLLVTPGEDRYDEYQIEILKKTP